MLAGTSTSTHSYLKVRPPIVQRQPFRYQWHQDGGRQNVEKRSPRYRTGTAKGTW